MRKSIFTIATILSVVTFSATAAFADSSSFKFGVTSKVGKISGTVTASVSKQQLCYQISAKNKNSFKSIQLWAAGKKVMDLQVSKIGSSKLTCVKPSNSSAVKNVVNAKNRPSLIMQTTSGLPIYAYLINANSHSHP